MMVNQICFLVFITINVKVNKIGYKDSASRAKSKINNEVFIFFFEAQPIFVRRTE